MLVGRPLQLQYFSQQFITESRKSPATEARHMKLRLSFARATYAIVTALTLDLISLTSSSLSTFRNNGI